MRVKRNITAKCLKLLQDYPAIAILGVRQSGKTELSKVVGTNWEYIDLEDGDDFDLVSRDIKFFLKNHPSKVIFDEAQIYPDLFSRLRGVIDADRDQKGRFILTGSSSPELVKNISESLAGRIAIVELGTLKSNEFFEQELSPLYSILSSKRVKKNDINSLLDLKPQIAIKDYLNFWFYGGYPEPTLRKDYNFWSSWMQNYFQTYVDRDLRKIFPSLDLVRYRRFVQMLAHVSGTTLVKKDLAQSIEVSESSIKDYLEISNGTFFWRNLTSFQYQIKKAVFKMPRGHIRDSGLLHFLLKLRDPKDLQTHPSLGRSFESFVIEELLKGFESSSITGWSAHYYRTRAKSEIDLILHGPFGIIPIEIKHGSSAKRKDYSTIDRFVKEHNLKFGILINNSDRVQWLNENIVQIPAMFV